jgi:hypothetical protein
MSLHMVNIVLHKWSLMNMSFINNYSTCWIQGYFFPSKSNHFHAFFSQILYMSPIGFLLVTEGWKISPKKAIIQVPLDFFWSPSGENFHLQKQMHWSNCHCVVLCSIWTLITFKYPCKIGLLQVPQII